MVTSDEIRTREKQLIEERERLKEQETELKRASERQPSVRRFGSGVTRQQQTREIKSAQAAKKQLNELKNRQQEIQTSQKQLQSAREQVEEQERFQEDLDIAREVVGGERNTFGLTTQQRRLVAELGGRQRTTGSIQPGTSNKISIPEGAVASGKEGGFLVGPTENQKLVRPVASAVGGGVLALETDVDFSREVRGSSPSSSKEDTNFLDSANRRVSESTGLGKLGNFAVEKLDTLERRGGFGFVKVEKDALSIDFFKGATRRITQKPVTIAATAGAGLLVAPVVGIASFAATALLGAEGAAIAGTATSVGLGVVVGGLTIKDIVGTPKERRGERIGEVAVDFGSFGVGTSISKRAFTKVITPDIKPKVDISSKGTVKVLTERTALLKFDLKATQPERLGTEQFAVSKFIREKISPDLLPNVKSVVISPEKISFTKAGPLLVDLKSGELLGGRAVSGGKGLTKTGFNIFGKISDIKVSAGSAFPKLSGADKRLVKEIAFARGGLPKKELLQAGEVQTFEVGKFLKKGDIKINLGRRESASAFIFTSKQKLSLELPKIDIKVLESTIGFRDITFPSLGRARSPGVIKDVTTVLTPTERLSFPSGDSRLLTKFDTSKAVKTLKVQQVAKAQPLLSRVKRTPKLSKPSPPKTTILKLDTAPLSKTIQGTKTSSASKVSQRETQKLVGVNLQAVSTSQKTNQRNLQGNITRTSQRESQRLLEGLVTRSAQRTTQRTAQRSLQRTALRTRQRTLRSTPIFVSPIDLREQFIPPSVGLLLLGKGRKGKKKKKSGSRSQGVFFTPTLGATQFKIFAGKKEKGRLLKQAQIGFTGLEVRPIIR